MGPGGALALAAWLGRGTGAATEQASITSGEEETREMEDREEGHVIGGGLEEAGSRLQTSAERSALEAGYVCPLRTVYLGDNRLGVSLSDGGQWGLGCSYGIQGAGIDVMPGPKGKRDTVQL